MLGQKGLLPERSKPKHLLWTLYFLKVYPKQSPGCSTVGTSKGAVDPKTKCKWVWQFIACIGELADDAMSFFMMFIPNNCPILPRPHRCHLLSPRRIVFESRLGAHDVGNDCTMTVDGTDFWIPQKGAATRGNAFASHKYAGKSAIR